MKKVLTIMCCIAAGFSSCKKEENPIPINPPSGVRQPAIMKKDTTFPDKGMVVPKADTIIGAWNFDTKDALGVTGIGAKISFAYSGAFRPSTGLRNVYYLIKSSESTVLFRSETKLSVFDGVTSFAQPNPDPGFIQAKTYRIELHAEVLAAASDNIGPDDRCTATFELIYQSDRSAVNKTASDAGQTITFSLTPSSTLETSTEAVSSAPQAIVGNQEITVLTMKVKSIGGASMLSNQTLLISDPIAASVISSIKVYDSIAGSLTLIGSGTLSGQTGVVSLALSIPENAEKTLVVKASIGAVTLAASSASFSATSDKITYKDAGNVAKINDVDRTGAVFTLLKAMQIVTSIPLSGTLQNGVLGDGFKFRVLSMGGNTASKQFAFKVSLIDNGTHVDTLSFKNLYFKVNGAIATNIRFTNSAGQQIDSVGPADNIVYVTVVSGSHEFVNPTGTPIEYVLGGRFSGYNHQGAGGDGDVGAIELLSADNPTSYRYVNSGVAPNNLNAKLFSSSAANTGAVMQYYIWSDISAGAAHSFAFGTATADAKNAAVGVIFIVQPQNWQRYIH